MGAREVGVAVIGRDPHCRLEDLLLEMPALREKLTGVDAGPERGAVTTTRRLRRVAVGRVALVGDGSGSADAITGEGLGIAFRQALLLADCIVDNDLERYNRRHPATLKMQRRMARGLLLMDRFPALRDRAIGMLADQPDLFDRLLAVHVGEEPLGRFMATRGWSMAWRLATLSRSERTLLSDSLWVGVGWTRRTRVLMIAKRSKKTLHGPLIADVFAPGAKSNQQISKLEIRHESNAGRYSSFRCWHWDGSHKLRRLEPAAW
jgi:hypothetical protein